MLILLLLSNIALAFIVFWTNEKLRAVSTRVGKVNQGVVESLPGLVKQEIERQKVWKEAFPMEGIND